MKSTTDILRKPVQVFILTATGLASALVSDGVGDLVGWVCLAYVLGVAVRHSLTRSR